MTEPTPLLITTEVALSADHESVAEALLAAAAEMLQVGTGVGVGVEGGVTVVEHVTDAPLAEVAVAV